MFRKTFFFDRDGVINVEKGYITDYSQFIFTNGACEAIKVLNNNNFLVILITNQAAIGKNLMSENDLLIIHNKMKKDLLRKKNAKIDDIFYCPYYQFSKKLKYRMNKIDRKPNNGMLSKAILKWKINVKKSFFIGDKPTDKIASEKSKVKFFYKNNLSLDLQVKNIIKNY